MQCCNCSSPEDLHPHHIIPLEKGGNDIPSNTAYVCRTCLSLLYPSLSLLVKNGLDKTEKKAGRPRIPADKMEKALQLYSSSNLSVREIIEQTGISQGSLYRHVNLNELKRKR